LLSVVLVFAVFTALVAVLAEAFVFEDVLALASVATFALVLASGVGVACGVAVELFKTDTSPRIAGIAKSKAEIKNVIAAAIVILDKIVCVPLAPKAVLETLLVNKAPASVFPGCNNTAIIIVMQDNKNKAVKI
jgi:hypothetical protein